MRNTTSLTLSTHRLTLIAATCEHLHAEIDAPERLTSLLHARVEPGWPPGEYDRDAMEFFRERLQENSPENAGWYSWYAIRRATSEYPPVLIGAGGYFGPPNATGEVEIGFSVMPAWQGVGYATEIAKALIEHAFTDPRVKSVIAHAASGNVASCRVLEKCGFRDVGTDDNTGTRRFEIRNMPRSGDFLDRPWQHLTLLSAAEIAAQFASPPPEYGLILWWGWTGHMTEAVIRQDLDDIAARGVRCVMIEAGYGLEPPYLSPGWFEAVRFAVEEARCRNMRVWLVDEGKYPSGFAGGKFSAERPDLRMQALVIADRVAVVAGEQVILPLAPETVGVLAVNLADQSSLAVEIGSGELCWTAPTDGLWELWMIQRQFRTSVTRYVHNPTRQKDTSASLCDYLNPEATRQFLIFVHEQYAQHLSAEFGRTILGFRGDEPDFAYTPWTPDLPDAFAEKKGYDVRPYLATLFAPSPTDEQRLVKADYWDVWSDLFSAHFFRIQAEWCEQHRLEYAVHLNHEDKLMALVASEGDFFKTLRHVQIPGVDAIWNQIWPGQVADFPKLASSVAHLSGRPRAFSESFAAYHIPPNAEQAKWVIDYQFARGINSLEVMFYPSSAEQPPRNDWLSSAEFPAVAAYVNRAAYLLSLGYPTAQIALYLPTSSLWLGDESASTATLVLARELLARQYDFDFVDDSAFASCLASDHGTLMNRSGQAYRAIIIPPISVIHRSTLQSLQAFAEMGGQVIWFGRAPELVVERTFLHATGPANIAWAFRESSPSLTPSVLQSLPQPDVLFDPPCPYVKCLHRRWRDADLYFLFSESTFSVNAQVTLAGNAPAHSWDALTGRIEPLLANSTGQGGVSIPMQFAPYSAMFITLGCPT